MTLHYLVALFQILFPILSGSFPAGGGQVQLDSDTFSGTSATQLHTYNANWVSSVFNAWCNPDVISTPNGGVYGNNACDERTGFTWTNDQWAQVTYNAAPSGESLLCVRMTATTTRPNGYCVGTSPGISGTPYKLYRIDAGVKTTLKTSAQNPVLGDVWNLQVIGSTITFKVNGTVVSALTDSADTTYTTGNPGFMLNDVTAGTKLITTWLAGSAS